MSERPRTQGQLLGQLRDAGALSDEAHDQALRRLAALPAAQPWYIQVLSGLGGLVAGALFLSFLLCTRLITEAPGALTFGALLVAGTTALRYIKPSRLHMLTQALLSLNLLGQALVLVGVGMATDEVWPVALTYLLLGPALYLADDDRLLRGVVACGWLAAQLTLAIDVVGSQWLNQLLVAGWVVGVVLIAGERGPLTPGARRQLRPLGYACALAVVLAAGGALFPDQGMLGELPTRITIAAPLCIMLGLIAHEASDGLDQAPATWSAAAAVVLALVSDAGILASVLMLVLGFWRARRPLIVLGAVSLVGFIVHFYYSLEISLLAKSGVLLGTGLSALALRVFLMRQAWMRTLREEG